METTKLPQARPEATKATRKAQLETTRTATRKTARPGQRADLSEAISASQPKPRTAARKGTRGAALTAARNAIPRPPRNATPPPIKFTDSLPAKYRKVSFGENGCVPGWKLIASGEGTSLGIGSDGFVLNWSDLDSRGICKGIHYAWITAREAQAWIETIVLNPTMAEMERRERAVSGVSPALPPAAPLERPAEIGQLTLGGILPKATLRRLPEAAAAFRMEPAEFVAEAVAAWMGAAEARPLVDTCEETDPALRYSSERADRIASKVIREAMSIADPDDRMEQLFGVHTLLAFHPAFRPEAVQLRDIVFGMMHLGQGGGLIERAASPEELAVMDEGKTLHA